MENTSSSGLKRQREAVSFPSWFSPMAVSSYEFQAMADYLEGAGGDSREAEEAAANRLEQYMRVRSSIIELYQASPDVYCSATSCRLRLKADASLIVRVHALLEDFKVINQADTLTSEQGRSLQMSAVYEQIAAQTLPLLLEEIAKGKSRGVGQSGNANELHGASGDGSGRELAAVWLAADDAKLREAVHNEFQGTGDDKGTSKDKGKGKGKGTGKAGSNVNHGQGWASIAAAMGRTSDECMARYASYAVSTSDAADNVTSHSPELSSLVASSLRDAMKGLSTDRANEILRAACAGIGNAAALVQGQDPNTCHDAAPTALALAAVSAAAGTAVALKLQKLRTLLAEYMDVRRSSLHITSQLLTEVEESHFAENGRLQSERQDVSILRICSAVNPAANPAA